MHTSFPAIDSPRTQFLGVRLSREEHARLAALAAERGRTMSELIRCLIPTDERRQLSRPKGEHERAIA